MNSSTYWPIIRRQGKRLVGWLVFVLVVFLILLVIGVSFDILPAL